MTVYPFTIHLGRFSITGYGIMMMFAFLGPGWVLARRLREEGGDENLAWDAVMWAVIGGLLGGSTGAHWREGSAWRPMCSGWYSPICWVYTWALGMPGEG